MHKPPKLDRNLTLSQKVSACTKCSGFELNLSIFTVMHLPKPPVSKMMSYIPDYHHADEHYVLPSKEDIEASAKECKFLACMEIIKGNKIMLNKEAV